MLPLLPVPRSDFDVHSRLLLVDVDGTGFANANDRVACLIFPLEFIKLVIFSSLA